MVSALFTGQIVKEPKYILLKYLTQCVCLNRCSITKYTQNQLSELANIYCLLYSQVKS